MMRYQKHFGTLSSGTSGCIFSSCEEVNNSVKSIKNYKQKTQCDGCGAPIQKSYWSCSYCGRDYWD